MTTTPITWIPVAERLPDDDSTVLLALADGDVLTGWHEGAVDPIPARRFDMTGWELDTDHDPVTHWADLPAAPQEAEAQPAQEVK